ncbi:MAG: envelope stress response membrane protein PspC [Alteromonadaceae bacterium]|nr:envelope stress response membrane protein PspC [Alteromonadaceae bacterium]
MSIKREFFRDPEKGKIAGVCAGIADYFGWELWLVRIIFVSGTLLTGGFFPMAYIIGWFILDKKPSAHAAPTAKPTTKAKGKGWVSSAADDVKVEVKSKIWQAGEPPKQAFRDINSSFSKLENRLRKVETYVTSSEYQLNREINRL